MFNDHEEKNETKCTDVMENPIPMETPSPDVEIHVRDKAVRRTEIFVVPISLLYDGMKYFQPVLEKALKLRSKKVNGSKKRQGRISLKVNCSIEIFHWLVSYLKKENPKFNYFNTVSLILSSHFLRMDDLTDTAFVYLRDHLGFICTSGLDMGCIPGELLGRFCSITKEYHVASALLSLYERGEEEHPGRVFLIIVARHLAIMRLTGNTIASSHRRWDEGVSSVFSLHSPSTEGTSLSSLTSTGPPNHEMVKKEKPDPHPSIESGSIESLLAHDNGLRWCRLCGILYNSTGIQRLLKSGKCTEPSCDALTNEYELCMGPRGETFTSHVASDQPVSISPPSTWDHVMIEHWSWQVIGSLILVVCTVCRSPCSLIEALSHSCPEVMFVSEEPGYGNDEMEVILRWMQLSIEEQSQRGEPNHLVPLRQALGTPQSFSSLINFERIVLPRYTAKVRVNSCAPTFTTLSAATGNHKEGEAGALVDLPWACTWQGQYNRAREVALGYDGGIDVDLLNFFERQMMNQLYQCRAEAAALYPGEKARFSLSVTPQNNYPLSYVHHALEKVDRFHTSQKRTQKPYNSFISSASHSAVSSSKDCSMLSSSLLRSKNNMEHGDDAEKDSQPSKAISRGYRRK